jgi:hypothetical protein
MSEKNPASKKTASPNPGGKVTLRTIIFSMTIPVLSLIGLLFLVVNPLDLEIEGGFGWYHAILLIIGSPAIFLIASFPIALLMETFLSVKNITSGLIFKNTKTSKPQ